MHDLRRPRPNLKQAPPHGLTLLGDINSLILAPLWSCARKSSLEFCSLIPHCDFSRLEFNLLYGGLSVNREFDPLPRLFKKGTLERFIIVSINSHWFLENSQRTRWEEIGMGSKVYPKRFYPPGTHFWIRNLTDYSTGYHTSSSTLAIVAKLLTHAAVTS